MEWRIIALNYGYAVGGVILMFLAVRLIDLLTPKNEPLRLELQKGNIAAAIYLAALLLSIAIILHGSLN
jgi:uncharacterized membrane protein YjfL (UPF0719 family)